MRWVMHPFLYTHIHWQLSMYTYYLLISVVQKYLLFSVVRLYIHLKSPIHRALTLNQN